MSLTPRIDRLEKNYLINGGMDYFQRSETASFTVADVGGGTFITADRWSLRRQGSWNVLPLSQRSQTRPTEKVLYSNSITGDPANSSSSLSHFQPIESMFARELAGEVVSFSAWVRSESARDARFILDVPDTQDDYSSSSVAYDVTQAEVLTIGDWTLVKFEDISVPLTATRGLRAALLVTNMSVTGSSVEHNVTQLMLNRGPRALDFQRAGLNVIQEEILCQRYYEKSYRRGVRPGNVGDFQGSYRTRVSSSPTTEFFGVSFNTPKWTSSSTITLYSPDSGASGNYYNDNDSADAAGSSSAQSHYQWTMRTAASTPGGDDLISFQWTADSEIV